MSVEFAPQLWDDALIDDLQELLRLAVREDLGRGQDWTTLALVPMDAMGKAAIVARKKGVAAGLPAGQFALWHYTPEATFTPLAKDGDIISPGQTLALLQGPARALLTAERTILNLIGHMSGIATQTRRFVDLVQGTKAQIYDTRKTMPGYRRLDKYAVRMGGGFNHRAGLYDAFLIKDNHLAFGGVEGGFTPLHAVQQARALAKRLATETTVPSEHSRPQIVEVEVDNLGQLQEVLPACPDIVLLDNMKGDQLKEAVRMRDEVQPSVVLEASGGVNLDTARGIAECGVDRISVGGLTHSVEWWDVGLDWKA